MDEHEFLEVLDEAVESALDGHEGDHHFVIGHILEYSGSTINDASYRRQILRLPVPKKNEAAYDLALALRNLGEFEAAASCMKKVADRGDWRAAYRLGYWRVHDPSFKGIDIDGFKYLMKSSGPGHREGAYIYHLSLRSRAPLYMRPYHFIAVIYYMPFMVNRIETMGR